MRQFAYQEVSGKMISHLSKDQTVSVTAMRNLSLQKQMEQEKGQLFQENTALKKAMKERYKFGNIIGRCQAMQRVYELISKAAASKYPVVISGESGTGKELVAQTIHSLQSSHNEPFVTVNCGAVTESLFEREFFGHRKGSFTGAIRDEPGYLDAAQGGTLFLDEIGELPLVMQVKLLRVLESFEYTPVGDTVSKKADVRIVSATNKDIDELVAQGKFRHDLYYRIQVIEINLPPLRERRGDFRLLVEYILSEHKAEDKVTDLPQELTDVFYNYHWPGNVRELTNTIQCFLATGSVNLPGQPKMAISKDSLAVNGLSGAVESLEKKIIGKTLHRTNWHRGKTADRLKIPRRSLLRKMQKYDLKPPGS